MKRTVVVNGDERDVEVEGDRVTVDGRTFRVEAEPRAGGYDVRVDGELFDVEVESTSFGVYEGAVDGTGFELLHAAQAKKLAEHGAGRAREIEAPMPGTVVGVEVEEGQQVGPGACLLTLEAMKMENEILTEWGGVVQEIHVRAGDAVDGGQVLVVVGPEEEE